MQKVYRQMNAISKYNGESKHIVSKTNPKTGMLTETLPSRKDFRVTMNLTNAEAKRQYRALQFAVTKPNQATFNALITGGNVCAKVSRTRKGRYAFIVTKPVDAAVAKVASVEEYATTLNEDQKAKLLELLTPAAA